MDLGSYVAQLPSDKRATLYDSHWTCQALLRSLPPVAQQYVLRMLFLNSPIERGLLGSWIRPEHRGTHDRALTTLSSLQIVQTVDVDGNKQGLQLHPSFQTQLRSVF